MKIIPILLSAVLACCAASKPESREGMVYRAQNWDDVYRLYVEFHGESDGVVAGAFVDKISNLLDEHWAEASHLDKLVSRHPSFGPFIYRHLGDSVPLKRYERIKQHATRDCPAELKSFCRELLNQLEE